MSLGAILADQLTDPFRIGLIVALVATMLRTETVTGRWLPLAAGVAFVAVIIPLTFGGEEPAWRLAAAGLLANAVILAVVLGLWRILRGRLP